MSMFTCSTKHGVRWGPKTFGILTSTAPPSLLGLLTGADTLGSHPTLGAFRTVIVTSADQSGEVSPSDHVFKQRPAVIRPFISGSWLTT